MDLLALVKIAVDVGLVVLALLVQRIIYPSFIEVNGKQFLVWHKKYTKEIGRIVAPLMLAQLAISAFFVWETQFGRLSSVVFGLVIVTWVDTFARAMPLHAKLQQVKSLSEQIKLSQKLVQVNLPRTLIWALILGLQCYIFFNP